ncbi:hypothetical protein BH09PSE2_BH09PSE2_05540 [soil metagenome]
MVSLVETSADALSRLLSDVLDLARVEQGGLELVGEAFDLQTFTHDVATLFGWRAAEKGVSFACEVEPAVCGTYASDAVRLRQILSNLLSNAVKFTDAGSVTLRVSAGPQAGTLAFAVRDTGVGFSPEQADRLFERFSQADGSITRRFGGSGLGLAISRALALRMGGDLQATGVAGEGAEFTLVLPLKPLAVAEPCPQPSAAHDLIAGHRLRVLLAEDHPVNRKVVELILASADVDLRSVENGMEALEALREERFDLVLMDVQMPVMDGLTAMRAFRRFELVTGAVRTPVIALTANALPEHAGASLAAGADEHMTKPISATTLLDMVARITTAAPVAPETAATPVALAG